MAQYINNNTGNFSTAAIWDTVTNTPTLHATTNVSAPTTGLFTPTYTAPNTTNKATGVLVFFTGQPANGITVTATLYESGIATAAAGTLLTTNLTTLGGGWVYIRFVTPYTFTTTTAGAYKVQLKTSSSTVTLAADSGGTLVAAYITDNRNTAPTVGDDWVIAGSNATTTTTVTMTGTSNSTGAGVDTSASLTPRTIGMCHVTSGGTLKWDTAANATLTNKGSIIAEAGGNFKMGDAATPIPSGIVATLLFNQNGTGGNYGVITSGSATTTKISFYGSDQWGGTGKEATIYTSGLGTVVSPLVVTDVTGWNVGDEIVVFASSANATNYNEAEYKFIKTVVSTTSFTLADSAGGVESGFSFTHTNARIVNLTRNVIVDTTSPGTLGWYGFFQIPTPGNAACRFTRFNSMGANISNKNGLMAAGAVVSSCAVDYCVFDQVIQSGLVFSSSKVAETFTHNILSRGNVASNSGMCNAFGATANKTLQNCYFVKSNRQGFSFSSGAIITLQNCYFNALNSANTTADGAALLAGGSVTSFINCEFNANRVAAIYHNGTVSVTCTTCSFGTKGINQTSDIVCAASSYNTAVYDTCTFSSATRLSSASLMAAGSEIDFNQINATNYNNEWDTIYGTATFTGSGLTDTNVRTAGTYNIRVASIDATTGFVYSYYKVINVGDYAFASGQIQLNAAFTGDSGASCVVNLYLPGNQVSGATPDATYTVPKTTNAYQAYALFVNFAGTFPGLMRVDIVVKTTTASAYAYIADLDTGSNSLTNFKIYSGGKPSVLMPETIGDASIISLAVWNQLSSLMTTSGSIGAYLKNALTKGQFVALK